MANQSIIRDIREVLKDERKRIEDSRRGEEFKNGRLEQQIRIEAAIQMVLDDYYDPTPNEPRPARP